jgi:hypothetical protein
MNTPTPGRGRTVRRLVNPRTWSRPVRVTGAVAVLTASVFAVAGSPVSAAPAPHGKPAHPAKLPPPPQIKTLDPLLGKYKCDDAATPDQQFYVTNTRTLDGHYQSSEATIVPGDVHGIGTYGWDPVNGVFFYQYHDNWGSHSTESSPGWKDGHLTFTGDLLQVAKPDPTGHTTGAAVKITEEYSDVRPGEHFTSVSTVTYQGVDYPHTYDCNRVG